MPVFAGNCSLKRAAGSCAPFTMKTALATVRIAAAAVRCFCRRVPMSEPTLPVKLERGLHQSSRDSAPRGDATECRAGWGRVWQAEAGCVECVEHFPPELYAVVLLETPIL